MKAKHKRIFWTVLAAPVLLAVAVLLAALTRWLDGFIGGKALLLALLLAFCGWTAYQAWTWPGWTDD